MNQTPWLYYNSTTATWYGGYAGETAADSYEVAALSTVTAIVAGLEVRFWDTNGDGFTDIIDADYLVSSRDASPLLLVLDTISETLVKLLLLLLPKLLDRG